MLIFTGEPFRLSKGRYCPWPSWWPYQGDQGGEGGAVQEERQGMQQAPRREFRQRSSRSWGNVDFLVNFVRPSCIEIVR